MSDDMKARLELGRDEGQSPSRLALGGLRPHAMRVVRKSGSLLDQWPSREDFVSRPDQQYRRGALGFFDPRTRQDRRRTARRA